MIESNLDLILAGMFVLLFVLVALYSLAIPQGDRRWWGLTALLAALVLAGLFLGDRLPRMLCLDGAAFVAVALVWTRGTPEASRAARTYLQFLALAVVLLLVVVSLGNSATPPAPPLDKLLVALFIVGFGLKLALVPFYFWLPGVADAASPMTTALIISVVDIAAFGELAQLHVALPWLFGTTELWIVLALLSMFGGAVLALAQRDIKRMLAFSTIDDMGYLVLGLVVGNSIGLSGALLGAMSHALVKVLLFGAVGVAEQGLGKKLTLDTRGLAARFPVSGAAFVVGALAMIGVPPLFGFVGRWRLYLAGAESGGVGWLLAMALATALALLYYARAIHRVWLGPPPTTRTASRGEPRLAASVLLVLIVVVVALGLFPLGLTSALP